MDQPLRPGNKYRFIYSLDGGRTHYSSVGRLLSVEKDTYWLSMRPVSGTARLDRRWVVRVLPVAADTRPMSNTRWKGAT